MMLKPGDLVKISPRPAMFETVHARNLSTTHVVELLKGTLGILVSLHGEVHRRVHVLIGGQLYETYYDNIELHRDT